MADVRLDYSIGSEGRLRIGMRTTTTNCLSEGFVQNAKTLPGDQMKQRCKVGGLLSMVVLLQGCVAFAAAPLLTAALIGTYAVGGFMVYKSVQLTTGGSAEVRFKEAQVSPENRDTMAGIIRLAVLPGTTRNVRITEELMRRTTSYEIVTPAQVLRTIQADDKMALLGSAESQLTEDEIVKHLSDLSEKLRVDAVLIYREASGAGVDASIWSFKRGEITTNFAVSIFSPKTGRFIWDQPGQVAMQLGTTQPPQEEIDKLVAGSVVDRLLEALKPKGPSA